MSFVLDQIVTTEKASIDHHVAAFGAALLKGIQTDPIKRKQIDWKQIAPAIADGWNTFKTLEDPHSSYTTFMNVLTVEPSKRSVDNQSQAKSPPNPSLCMTADETSNQSAAASPSLYSLPESFETLPADDMLITFEALPQST